MKRVGTMARGIDPAGVVPEVAVRPAKARAGFWQRVRWRIVYVIWLGFERGISSVPPSWALRIGRWIGSLAYAIDARHRRIVACNLKHAFDHEMTLRQRIRLARDVFQRHGMVVAEMVQGAALKAEQHFEQRFEFHNEEAVVEALSRYGQLVVVTTHTGNWELAGETLAQLGIEATVVVKAIKNPHLDARLKASRQAQGYRMVDKHGAVRELVRELRGGRSVMVAIDQNTRKHHVFVDFFGRPVAAPATIGTLCRRFGIPAVVVCTSRVGWGDRHLVEFSDPIVADAGIERSLAELRIVREATSFLEGFVRRHPGDWLWLHRRWRTRPPGEVAIEGVDFSDCLKGDHVWTVASPYVNAVHLLDGGDPDGLSSETEPLHLRIGTPGQGGVDTVVTAFGASSGGLLGLRTRLRVAALRRMRRRLLRLGFDVPGIVGHVRAGSRLWPRALFLLDARVGGAAMLWQFLSMERRRQQRTQVIRSVALYMRDLHDHGLVHREFDGRAFAVDGDGSTVLLVGVESLCRRMFVGAKQRQRELAELARALGPFVTRAECRRALSAYLDNLPRRYEERDWWYRCARRLGA